MKKQFILTLFAAVLSWNAQAQTTSVTSPDGKLSVSVSFREGKAYYAVDYDGQPMVSESRLGAKTSLGDFSSNLTLVGTTEKSIDNTYRMRGTKCSQVRYVARQANFETKNDKGERMTITFNVSNNDIAFRYVFPASKSANAIIVDNEATAFRFPQSTTTFICPQSGTAMGWMKSKPSYEEEYKPDAPMDVKSRYGEGYTFPCLFHIHGDKQQDGWVLVSETGTNGQYVGCHLSDYDAASGYTVAFPMKGENRGVGDTSAAMPLPAATPWRTLTVGRSLAPIVETTIPYDVVDEQYRPSTDYKPGRYTWSWLIWQDNSINMADQKQFVDLASRMGYEYCLVDGCWDVTIGRDSIAALSRYAQQRGVSLMLWYNSNGIANDAPQTPRNCMNTALARQKEMAWMKQIGVKGIKVDFFGGDKQMTMQLYEDILNDANHYGLQVIFHGCTLPRGWERMYPNYVASEAVLASENVYFSDYFAKQEPFQLTLHPFCRNAVAAMDWGGSIFNNYMSRDNKSRHKRCTTVTFEMAAALVNQSSINCIAMTPNNLNELDATVLDFLKKVPTAWDETRFLAGYPGKYVVLARRHGDRWYIAGLNAEEKAISVNIDMKELAGQRVALYSDTKAAAPIEAACKLKEVKVDKKGRLTVTMQPNGGVVIL